MLRRSLVSFVAVALVTLVAAGCSCACPGKAPADAPPVAAERDAKAAPAERS